MAQKKKNAKSVFLIFFAKEGDKLISNLLRPETNFRCPALDLFVRFFLRNVNRYCDQLKLQMEKRMKQARKSSEDAQAAGYTQLEFFLAGLVLGQKSLGPKY